MHGRSADTNLVEIHEVIRQASECTKREFENKTSGVHTSFRKPMKSVKQRNKEEENDCHIKILL